MFVSFRWLDIPLLLVFLSASLLVQGCELDKEGCAAGDTILVDAVTRCESCLLNAALSHDSCAYFGEEADPNYCTNVDACRDSDCRFLGSCQAAVDDLTECLLQEETVFQCPLSCAQFSPSAVITVPTTISPAEPSSSPPPVGSPTPAEPAVVTYTVGPRERASFTCPRDSFCCPSQGDNIWEGLDADVRNICQSCSNGCAVGFRSVTVEGGCTGTPCEVRCDADCTALQSTPTLSPTASPSASPTNPPSRAPTLSPTASPTSSPTVSPTAAPSGLPTVSPTSLAPTLTPGSPTLGPTNPPPSSSPTTAAPTSPPPPTVSPQPTPVPATRQPTPVPAPRQPTPRPTIRQIAIPPVPPRVSEPRNTTSGSSMFTIKGATTIVALIVVCMSNLVG